MAVEVIRTSPVDSSDPAPRHEQPWHTMPVSRIFSSRPTKSIKVKPTGLYEVIRAEIVGINCLNSVTSEVDVQNQPSLVEASSQKMILGLAS